MKNRPLLRVLRVLEAKRKLQEGVLKSEQLRGRELRQYQLGLIQQKEATFGHIPPDPASGRAPQSVYDLRIDRLSEMQSQLQPVLARAALSRHVAQDALLETARHLLSVEMALAGLSKRGQTHHSEAEAAYRLQQLSLARQRTS